MPVDYSKFAGIVDSDSEDENDMRGRFMEDDSPPGSPRISPRAALAALAAQRTSTGEDAAGDPGGADSAMPSASSAGLPSASSAGLPVESFATPSFERFLELLQGAEAARGDDALELTATARATVQSALAAGDADAPRRLLSALLVGLDAGGAAEAKPTEFARDWGPELIGELLATSASGLVAAEDIELALKLVAEGKGKDTYTFLTEAFTDGELTWAAKLKGIGVFKVALLAMKREKRHMFLCTCFPLLLKQFTAPACPRDLLEPKIHALHDLAKAFVEPCSGAEVDTQNTAVVVNSIVSAFLFKLVQRSLPLVALKGLHFGNLERASGSSDAAAAAPVRPAGPAAAVREAERQIIQLQRSDGGDALVVILSSLARTAASSSHKRLQTLLEEMDVGNPKGDGGGDLEVSSLCLACHVCLLELHGCWRELRPQVLPIGLSPARRLNVLMRSCYVLLSNQGQPSSAGTPCWGHSGLALFAASAAPLLAVVATQTPQAFATLHNKLCQWHPVLTFQALLEALSSTPDIDREVRGCLFRKVQGAMQAFPWSSRFEIYIEIIEKCRVDAAIGAVVTTFKDDWWPHVRALAEKGESLVEERDRLIRVLKSTLSGDVQIIDGMDTLTGTLNIARLVALAGPPVGSFLRKSLRKGSAGIDLEDMLAGVSQQIDFEMDMLRRQQEEGASGSLAADLEKEIAEQLGHGEGGSDMLRMKSDRVTMVAHLVARVREILAEAQD